MSQQVEARKDDNLTFLTLAQSYNYDGLNRLMGVGETGGTAWSQTFAYDRNGNQAVTATFPMTGMAVNQLDRYDLGTNRLVKYNDGTALPAGVYDAAGNLTNHRDLGALGYDAENRMTQVTSGASSGYGYDGEGRRVRRVTGGVGWTYVYDALGRLAAEVGGTAGSGISYLTADQLGSTRVVTNGSGVRTMCSDYLPFGEQMTTGSPGSSRGGVGCYGMAGTVAQRFTGKERDAETGLDYFGARYMSSAQGRFTHPDLKLFPDAVYDPQSWNKYGYVRNNPLRLVDPNGEDWKDVAGGFLNAFNTNQILGIGRTESGNSDFRRGQAIGDAVSTIQGAVEIIAGSGGEGAGLGLDATGVGAFAGVPLNVASATVITHGVAVGGLGLKNFANAAFKTDESGTSSTGQTQTQTGGPKAADAKGTSASGQATNQYGQKLGPSGKPTIQNIDHANKKNAKDAARNAGQGAPMQHPSPTRGKPHYHSTDRQGKKVPDGAHHNYPE